MASGKDGQSARNLATEDTFRAAYTARRGARHHDREVLTFRIGAEVYGIDMTSMREISKMRTITELPRVPSFLKGIITLRGQVIPILDLRLRMSMAAEAVGRNTRILVVNHGEEPFGLIVDQVQRVVRMVDSQIENAPLPGGIESDFLAGVARVDDELIVLLDLAAVVSFSIDGASR
jgi:purine-binding chemotaxis protein CheW